MRFPRSIQPALAALLAACVVFLGLAAQAPALHDALCARGEGHDDRSHGHAHAHLDANAHACASAPADHADDPSADADPAVSPDAPADHRCAITLFASGCESPTPPLPLFEPVLNAIRVTHFTEFMLARTLRGPARVCGPPTVA